MQFDLVGREQKLNPKKIILLPSIKSHWPEKWKTEDIEGFMGNSGPDKTEEYHSWALGIIPSDAMWKEIRGGDPEKILEVIARGERPVDDDELREAFDTALEQVVQKHGFLPSTLAPSVIDLKFLGVERVLRGISLLPHATKNLALLLVGPQATRLKDSTRAALLGAIKAKMLAKPNPVDIDLAMQLKDDTLIVQLARARAMNTNHCSQVYLLSKVLDAVNLITDQSSAKELLSSLMQCLSELNVNEKAEFLKDVRNLVRKFELLGEEQENIPGILTNDIIKQLPAPRVLDGFSAQNLCVLFCNLHVVDKPQRDLLYTTLSQPKAFGTRPKFFEALSLLVTTEPSTLLALKQHHRAVLDSFHVPLLRSLVAKLLPVVSKPIEVSWALPAPSSFTSEYLIRSSSTLTPSLCQEVIAFFSSGTQRTHTISGYIFTDSKHVRNWVRKHLDGPNFQVSIASGSRDVTITKTSTNQRAAEEKLKLEKEYLAKVESVLNVLAK